MYLIDMMKFSKRGLWRYGRHLLSTEEEAKCMSI
jgi:hypothetical protein